MYCSILFYYAFHYNAGKGKQKQKGGKVKGKAAKTKSKSASKGTSKDNKDDNGINADNSKNRSSGRTRDHDISEEDASCDDTETFFVDKGSDIEPIDEYEFDYG